MKIAAVDWGKETKKRAAFQADISTRTITRFPFDGTLKSLIEYALSETSPVLIAIDAALGFPDRSWKRLVENGSYRPVNFMHYLLAGLFPDDFFEPVRRPQDWKPERPFIRPPRGGWSRHAFEEASDGGFYRQVDKRLEAQPIFVTSGMPGTVGGGTRVLWQEMVAEDPSCFSVWPFHGALDDLLDAGKPVIAEIYPKACYGLALADTLPAALRPIAKTKEDVRESTILELLKCNWLKCQQVKIADVDAALSNEDDFDALLSAAALMRMFLEKAPLESPQTVNAISEGGVLGEASLNMPVQPVSKVRRNKPIERKIQGAELPRSYPCPIPKCSHVFQNSRGGWDSHVASSKRHPNWHPKTRDGDKRKLLFKQEFADWFKK